MGDPTRRTDCWARCSLAGGGRKEGEQSEGLRVGEWSRVAILKDLGLGRQG